MQFYQSAFLFYTEIIENIEAGESNKDTAFIDIRWALLFLASSLKNRMRVSYDKQSTQCLTQKM